MNGSAAASNPSSVAKKNRLLQLHQRRGTTAASSTPRCSCCCGANRKNKTCVLLLLTISLSSLYMLLTQSFWIPEDELLGGTLSLSELKNELLSVQQRHQQTRPESQLLRRKTNTIINNITTIIDTSKETPSATIRKKKKNGIVVAYVIVLTDCGHDMDVPFQVAEGAAVLKYSIQKQTSNYDYKMYAFYHPQAAHCAPVLQELGYTTQERNTPVQVSDIRGEVLRSRIEKNGCCGEKELIKLEAFTLIDHPIVVLLDLDVLVLKPLDRLFDFILNSQRLPNPDDLLQRDDNIMEIPDKIDLLYTTDYAMVSPGRKIKPTQGGFVILRPNRTVYKDFREIILEGDFRDENGLGWGGKTGKFWGAMTFQGLIPYYYQVLHPGRAVELNWCVWNNMCSPSRTQGVNVTLDQPVGDCYTQQENCEDCRNRPISEVGLTHFTVCQKPWLCQRHNRDVITERLCRAFHHAWFQTRSEMEQSWGRSGWGPGTHERELFMGYCTRFGQMGYEVIQRPFGQPSSTE